ncbi:MAG: LOG family protein [Verrucomicrobiales bacterium]
MAKTTTKLRFSTGDPEFDERIRSLVKDWGCDASAPLVEEMIMTALRMGKDSLPESELKLYNRALKELRQAARVFSGYQDRKKISVFGSARTPLDAPESQAAIAFSQRMLEHGYMTITGGGDGIMGAAQKGAGREESFGLNIKLPFEQSANETIDGDAKLINFNYFFTRKLNFVKESDAIALFPGGYGTMDEGFEVLTLIQTGKARMMPIILMDRPGGTYWKTWVHFIEHHLLRLKLISPTDLALYRNCASVEEAVEEVLTFYKVYHSSRYVQDQMSIRLNAPLTTAAVNALNKDFADILAEGKIQAGQALPPESTEPGLMKLPRLILTPKRREFGRMRQLIDAINRSETQA